MAKDGTNRGGHRVRAGAKPDPLNEKLTAGRPATRLEDPLNEPFDFEGSDIGDGALLAGETMPDPNPCTSSSRQRVPIRIRFVMSSMRKPKTSSQAKRLIRRSIR